MIEAGRAAVGIVHPGAMGAAVGAVLRGAERDVAWASAGRSNATRQRAAGADLAEAADLRELASVCGAIVSVCPPASARDVAAAVVEAGFDGLYVDANAIAPATARVVGDAVTAAGCRFVDGGIVGGPPREPGTTRLYLAGDEADEVAGWFDGTVLEAIVVGDQPGAASALKAAYAGWTKGSAALLLAVRSLARAAGVEEALLGEWDRSIPELRDRSDRVASTIHRKAWRFEGELREIASALSAAGLPGGFHVGAADVYARLADLKDDPEDQDPVEVLDRIRGGSR